MAAVELGHSRVIDQADDQSRHLESGRLHSQDKKRSQRAGVDAQRGQPRGRDIGPDVYFDRRCGILGHVRSGECRPGCHRGRR